MRLVSKVSFRDCLTIQIFGRKSSRLCLRNPSYNSHAGPTVCLLPVWLSQPRRLLRSSDFQRVVLKVH